MGMFNVGIQEVVSPEERKEKVIVRLMEENRILHIEKESLQCVVQSQMEELRLLADRLKQAEEGLNYWKAETDNLMAQSIKALGV